MWMNCLTRGGSPAETGSEVSPRPWLLHPKEVAFQLIGTSFLIEGGR